MPLRAFFAEAIRWLFGIVAAHQYVALFVIIAIEEGGVPLPAPGDLVIAFYGFLARDDPYEVAQVILVCAAASTAGTLVPYTIARRWGVQAALVLARWMDARPETIEKWTARIERNGFRAVLIGRLIPGFRVAMSLVAGTAKVPVARFSAAVFVAATIYWTGWVMIGVLVGPEVVRRITPTYLGYLLLVVPVVFVGYVVYRVLRARRHQR